MKLLLPLIPLLLLPAPSYAQTHTIFGHPGGTGTVLDKEYFLISYNTEAKVPEWTAYKLLKRDLIENVKRTDNFREDPDLPESNRSTLKDYYRSGFARGHLAPADDFTRSLTAMSSTFFLSNMAPQKGSLNSGKWRVLESNVQNVARVFDSCWVYTGTIFNLRLKEPRTVGEYSNGRQRRLGPNKVWVPTHFYKIILAYDFDGTVLSWAFLMPHRIPKLPGKVVDYAVSVDSLETLTNLDFFPDLPDDIESILESSVNTNWPIKED